MGIDGQLLRVIAEKQLLEEAGSSVLNMTDTQNYLLGALVELDYYWSSGAAVGSKR